MSKLNITFHNPNKKNELIYVLIKISAEIAKEKVIKKLLLIKDDKILQENIK